MSREIETQVMDDGVATLTLARAERWNALSIKRRDEITQQHEGLGGRMDRFNGLSA